MATPDVADGIEDDKPIDEFTISDWPCWRTVFSDTLAAAREQECRQQIADEFVPVKPAVDPAAWKKVKIRGSVGKVAQAVRMRESLAARLAEIDEHSG